MCVLVCALVYVLVRVLVRFRGCVGVSWVVCFVWVCVLYGCLCACWSASVCDGVRVGLCFGVLLCAAAKYVCIGVCGRV